MNQIEFGINFYSISYQVNMVCDWIQIPDYIIFQFLQKHFANQTSP